jgi:hypothetical protein
MEAEELSVVPKNPKVSAKGTRNRELGYENFPQKSSCAGKFSDVNYPYNDERKTSIPPQPEDEKAGFIFAKRTENKMRKAILCLIFATALFGQPTGVQVDLSVVSVDSGSGEVCFKAIVTTTGPLPTPPEFTYDYDWENDASYDLTDAGDSVCHTYTLGDSLWAKVKATTATYTAENSVEVVVPEEEEYTFEVLRTEADWESYNIRIYDLVTDDEGKLWLAGVQRPYNQGIRIDTITGEIDTLYDLDEMGYYAVRNKHVLRKFSNQVNIDTIITQFDTVFLPETEFDSLVVQPLFSDYPPWAITEKFINPGIIGSGGYYFAQLADSERKDSLYPGWKYAIGKDGELKHKIDLQLGQYTGSCSGNYFALQYGIGVDSGYTNLTLCDTSGAILWTKQILYYSLLRFGWDSGEPGIPKKYILQPNGNAFYLRGPEDELKLVMTNLLGDYEYAIPLADSMTRLMIGNLFAEDERLLLHTMETYPDTDINRIYFFDISDSLRVLWSTVATEIEPDKFGILTNGNPYITGCQISDYFSGIIDVFSRNDGSLITTLPDEPIRSSCWGKSVVHGDLILYLGCKEGGGFVPQAKLIKIKGGE